MAQRHLRTCPECQWLAAAPTGDPHPAAVDRDLAALRALAETGLVRRLASDDADERAKVVRRLGLIEQPTLSTVTALASTAGWDESDHVRDAAQAVVRTLSDRGAVLGCVTADDPNAAFEPVDELTKALIAISGNQEAGVWAARLNPRTTRLGTAWSGRAKLRARRRGRSVTIDRLPGHIDGGRLGVASRDADGALVWAVAAAGTKTKLELEADPAADLLLIAELD